MSIEAMKQALEALEYVKQTYDEQGLVSLGTNTAIIDLHQAIAEASQNGLYREGYRNGYAFGEAAGRKAVAKQDGACQHCAGKGCVACDARKVAHDVF